MGEALCSSKGGDCAMAQWHNGQFKSALCIHNRELGINVLFFRWL